MLGKQWLNRYLRNSGGSMIERCGDRQRKCDGLEKWPLHFFIESLPLMLQAALFLLACGLCRQMWPINASVAYTLIGLTGLVTTFYVVIVIAGTSSYACPFQTPVSTALRGTPKRVKRVLSRIQGTWGWRVRRGVKRALSLIRKLWDRMVRLLPHSPSLSTTTSLSDVQVQESVPWLEPELLTAIHEKNANDVRCVSWILRNITDPEALDAAVRLAGTIRWFDGPDVDVQYDSIVSTFNACFDPAGNLYPGSRGRAYYSGRAMVWIHTLARCKFKPGFYLPFTKYEARGLDPDLRHLLRINQGVFFGNQQIEELLAIGPEHTPSHTQWVWDVLLHHVWINRDTLGFGILPDWVSDLHKTTTIPLNATLNRLLMWCILLDSPPAEEVLMVQNKSYGISCFVLQITHRTLR